MCSSTRGALAGGWASPGARVNTIDFITIATLGNAQDFGDATQLVQDNSTEVLLQLVECSWVELLHHHLLGSILLSI